MDARELGRQTFRLALQSGSFAPVESLNQFLANEKLSEVGIHPADLKSLIEAVHAEFPFLRAEAQCEEKPNDENSVKWCEATRSVLRDLNLWEPGGIAQLNRLRATLAVSQALGIGVAGFLSVSTEIVGNNLIRGLLDLIDQAQIGPFGGHSRRVPDLKEKLKRAEQIRDYRGLESWAQGIGPDLQEDAIAAIAILHQLVPDVLAEAIATKDDPVFSMLVAFVLGDEMIRFAAKVPLVSFKYLSTCRQLALVRLSRESPGWSEDFQQLLLQVANTPDWDAWMVSLFSAPSGGVTDDALAITLAKLDETHWRGFIKSLHLRHSSRETYPVANIMVRFSDLAGPAKASVMWSIAFEEWNKWDYINDGNVRFMDEPAACAIDYPVIMYYVHSKSVDLTAELAKLAREVDFLEERWFESVSDLVTERNRLLSRRRLVQHAYEIVQESSAASLLPQAYKHSDTDFVRVRYLYRGQ